MSLAELTALMSKVGRKHPDLMQDRNVALFIQACIDEAKTLPQEHAPTAPVDVIDI
ncbi:hypothetical protein FF80_03362 [Devosia sp. LC5]|uniref:hypothetical protein n=1 Tax=Devosia sp. LC5 TaxID=1502724 RepID=UPI0004E2D985|nr:hypothetical protein [Devosia sp. LC5]KFC62795.1 hypothetical protein FF80_03362 [Devosia sp. LC5]